MNEKRLNEILARKQAIVEELKDADEERTKALDAETDALIEEEKSIRAKLDVSNKLGQRVETPAVDKRAQMGQALKQQRAITTSADGFLKPIHNQSEINGEIGGSVSSIIDLVDTQSRPNMSEYRVPYEKGGMTANKTAENTAATASDPAFAYAVIKPVTITTYTEISRESIRLTDVDYYELVMRAARKAMRKKVAEYIIKSDDESSPNFVGIVKSDTIDANTDMELQAIDATTLRKLAMSYGGEDDIVGSPTLFLTKKDLMLFGDVRGTNEKKYIYEITPDTANPNVGTIRDGGVSVRYCINNDLTDLAGAQEEGKVSMILGIPKCYELDVFSDFTVSVSEHYKFANRMLAVLGEVMVGGNVVVHNGFIRVKGKTAE